MRLELTASNDGDEIKEEVGENQTQSVEQESVIFVYSIESTKMTDTEPHGLHNRCNTWTVRVCRSTRRPVPLS